MPKSANILITICFSVMVMLLSLQAYWIVKYYKASITDFEKEINLAFEDGIKKELALRCDTIENIIKNKLLDTNAFVINARFDQKEKRYIYTVSAKGDQKDNFSSSFSLSNYNKAIPKNKSDTSVRYHIASHMAQSMREEDLETHTIYYRTQKLGTFMDEQAKKYQFDTTRLRPAFNYYLKERNIKVPYSFMVKRVDSTNNKGVKHLNYAFVTRAFETYRYTDNQHYVRAMFKDPGAYILTKMSLLLFSSLAMIIVVSGCMVIILKSLFREKRLSAIKNDFISNITHEFKTPISTVSVAIEALSHNEINQNEDKRTRYLLHAKNEIDRLNLLVDKILGMALYDGGKTALNKEQISINEAITQLITMHEISHKPAPSITFINHSNQQYINADKSQFQHAINNILDNAIKYSLKVPVIKIEVYITDQEMIIKTEDNGIGIAEKELANVFDKFYRVSTGNHHAIKGHGLGLNYVKQIMQNHHGWYKIESKPGSGTTVILGWPL